MELKNTNLQEIQQWMMNMLTNPLPPDVSENIEKHIKAGPRLNARRHFQIYRQSYIARLRECMKKQFAALAYTLGEELFVQFADEYLTKHPSDSYSLNTLGEKFVDFIEENRPDANMEIKEEWCDFMVDLASFEYALTKLFDAAEPKDGKPLIKVFKYRYNIARYYLEFVHEKKPELYLPQTNHCMVKRENYQLSIYEITEREFQAHII